MAENCKTGTITFRKTRSAPTSSPSYAVCTAETAGSPSISPLPHLSAHSDAHQERRRGVSAPRALEHGVVQVLNVAAAAEHVPDQPVVHEQDVDVAERAHDARVQRTERLRRGQVRLERRVPSVCAQKYE
jgi:hypothetical protein